MKVELPPAIEVGDMVMTNMFGTKNHLGIILKITNKLYWADYNVLLSNGQIAILGRSFILSREEYEVE